MDRSNVKIIVNEKAERSIRAGHPWVYRAEVLDREGAYQNGDMADVYSRKKRWLGAGFINDHSKILVRLISQNANDDFSRDFFRRRLEHAVDFRRCVMGRDFSACRLVFGEADFFPGWTVDRYEDILVSEVLSFGVDRRRELLYPLLLQVLTERGVTIGAIYERNEAALRDKEGLPKYKGFVDLPGLADDLDEQVEICENGLFYQVDYINGQKTGFFLDQKYNRRAAARLAKGRRVLDCCTHSGAFALNAAKNGAEQVTAVDVSADALELAEKNALRNGLRDKLDFIRADVFDLLTRLTAEKSHKYDYIILDPPAFTKSGVTLSSAFRGYKEINLKAMRLLPRGGYLATCSCSHFMTDDLFREMLKEAAQDAGVRLRQIERRQQGPDHPILWGVPETNYLKFYLMQIV